MKKNIFFIISLLLLASTIITVIRGRESKNVVSQQTSTTNVSTPTPLTASPILEIAKPSRLIIEKIGVDTSIEHVGLAVDGRMDVPKEDMNVAWYQLGSIPGAKGSAVLAGHFDNPTGGPAIFFRLNELKAGDSIKVVAEDNTITEFTVTNIQVYKDATFPIDLVFNPNTESMLNLITCDGTFDTTAKNYSDRLVVFSEKKA